jgi:hypothetical protein
MAKRKLVQAEHEPQRRTRLLTAAQGWLVLESELRRLEGCVTSPGHEKETLIKPHLAEV